MTRPPGRLDVHTSAASARPTASFDAFVSYNHADVSVAEAVQRGLHRLAKPVWSFRAMHVYRDRTDLAATPDLRAKIVAALDASRYLVVVCSPESARSPHVASEIRHWLDTGRISSLLLVLFRGELAWDAGRGCYLAGTSTALSDEFCRPGLWSGMPLYVDKNHLNSRGADLLQPLLVEALTLRSRNSR